MAGASLRELTIPRFALRREEAAVSLSISPSSFDNWVKAGKMPAGQKLGGILLWDVEKLRSAWYALLDQDEQDDSENPFDSVGPV